MADPCQVDFYVLADPSLSAGQLACRLCMMAWEQGHRVAVLAGNEQDADDLDELMWDFPPGRFLPHAPGGDVVINLGGAAIPQPERFRRLLEIVPADARQKQASREKFRQYREWGLSPGSHDIQKI
jgi:DNA polymerase-3 subunit chi